MNVDIDVQNLNSNLLNDFLVGRSPSPGSSRHSGQISDVNIWDYALTTDETRKWTSCRCVSIFKIMLILCVIVFIKNCKEAIQN